MSVGRHRICLVTSEIAPATPGGIGAVVRAMLQELDPKTFDVRLLLDLSQREARRVEQDLGLALPHVSVFRVEALTDCEIPLHAFPSESYWRSFRIWRALEAIARQSPLDAVEFPDFGGLGYVTIKALRLGTNRFLKARCIVRVHGSGELAALYGEVRRSSPPLLQAAQCERYGLRHADAVITPSIEVTQWLEKHYGRLHPTFEVAPPFSRWGEGNEHREPDQRGRLDLLFVGKLQPLKGVFELVRAALECVRVHGIGAIHLHLVGDDELAGALQRSIPDELQRAVTFYGALESTEIRRLAARCDAAVFPSKMETFCLSAHELNWLGMPLLLSDIPAFRAFFKNNRDALLFPPREVELRELLERLLASKTSLLELQWNAASIHSQTAEDYRALLDEIGVGDTSPPTPSPAIAAGSPRVSVIVPYFEMHEYVDEAIASVAQSESQDWEVVVVDDGSHSTGARAKFEELRTRTEGDTRYRFIRKQNGGLASARNAGIDVAQGDYVLPLDADDRISPTFLDTAVRALDRAPELGFVSCMARCFSDNRGPDQLREWIVPYDPHPSLLFYEHGCGTASCMFRRDVLREHPYDETLPAYEDWDLQLSLARADVRGEVIPEVHLDYRIRHDSMVRARAHTEHDLLLNRMLAKHTRELSYPVREAFEIYLHELTAMRGLGAGYRPLAISGARAAIFDALRAFHFRWTKPHFTRHLTVRQQRWLVDRIRRVLSFGQSPER